MASRFKHLRARALKALFTTHARLYEATDGRIGAHVGLPMLLLTVTGRKSGQPRRTPLVYFAHKGSYVVVGSDGGARRDPQWWKNLQVDPASEVRIGRDSFKTRARLAEGPERDELWQIAASVNPMWPRYQRTTKRSLPVVVLEPIDGSASAVSKSDR